MKSKYILLTSFVLGLIITLFIIEQQNAALGTIEYIIPPVGGKLVEYGDTLFFIQDIGTIKQYSKADLAEISSINVPFCSNMCYSPFLDCLIVVGGDMSDRLFTVDRSTLVITGEHNFQGRVCDIVAVENLLYVAWDNSSIMFAPYYDRTELPENTGALSEVTLPDFNVNWSTAVASLPVMVTDAGDYIAVASKELRETNDELGFTTQSGNLINMVNKITLNTVQRIAGQEDGNYLLYDGISKLYVNNPHGAWYIDDERSRGFTVIDINDWSVNNILLEWPLGSQIYWGVTSSVMQYPYVYFSTYGSKSYEGETFYGRYNVESGLVEMFPIAGIDQPLVQIIINNDTFYFGSYFGWLIKYTL